MITWNVVEPPCWSSVARMISFFALSIIACTHEAEQRIVYLSAAETDGRLFSERSRKHDMGRTCTLSSAMAGGAVDPRESAVVHLVPFNGSWDS